MSLKFSRIGDNDLLSLDIVRYKPKSHRFVLNSSGEPGNEFYFDFCFDKNPSYSHLKDSQFDVYLLHNSKFAANDIYQITDSKTIKDANRGRLGFLIPIQSLLNSEHDYGENEHFAPYAYHSIRILLSTRPSIPFKTLDLPTSTSYIDLESIYGENTHVLIFHKPHLRIWEKRHNIKFSIDLFYPCLWSYGYLHLISTNFESMYTDQENGTEVDNSEVKNIEILPISPYLRKDPFILNLFTSFLYNQKHELIRFHLLYQVIELLIEKVFQKELGGIINQFDTNISNFYDIREQLGKVANEKSRIDKLFNKYCVGHNSSLERLKRSCNELLTMVNPDYEKTSPTRALYKTRSIVFHSFRSLPIDHSEKLKIINTDFEDLIIKSITSFTDSDIA